MIAELDILLRVLYAALLGLIVGYERERQDHAAGLRTHMVLVIGAALAMPVSINIAVEYGKMTPGGDPGRLAAQVVSGIGFLGAGVIFRSGGNVRGLTTAASLWTMAVIGLAAGAGMYLASGAVTAGLLFVLTILNRLEDHWLSTYERLHIQVTADDRPGFAADVKGLLGQKKHKFGPMNIERDLANRRVTLEMEVRVLTEGGHERLVEEISTIPGVQRIKVSD